MKKQLHCITFFLAVGGTMNSESLNNNACKDGVCSIENRPVTIEGQETNSELNTVSELNLDTFSATIATATKPVIIDFYATWCQPCKQVKPYFHELAQEEENWQFYSIDVDKNPSIASGCSISAMPTFVIFQRGMQWGMVKGALPKDLLREEFHKIIESPTPQAMEVAQQSETTRQLIIAVNQSNLDAVKKLVQDGADVNGALETPQFTSSAIQAAIISSNESVIDYLLESGARLDAQVQENLEKQFVFFRTTIDKMQQNFDYALTKKEVRNSSPTKAVVNEELGQQFMAAIMNPELLKELLAKNVDINCAFSMGPYQVTPLYFAILLNNKAAVDALVPAGATLNYIIQTEGQPKTIEETIKQELAKMELVIIRSKERLAYALNKVKQMN